MAEQVSVELDSKLKSKLREVLGTCQAELARSYLNSLAQPQVKMTDLCNGDPTCRWRR